MTTVSMKQLLESGVHFGHQTRRWNPKMAKYIFGQRNGIYIIDLKKTVRLLKEACRFVRDLSQDGGKIVFVGTKKQAQDTVREEAKRCGQYYVNQRWLGGMLTNYQTLRKSIDKLKSLEEILSDEAKMHHLKKRERLEMSRQRDRIDKYLAGIKDMGGMPDAVFVTDTRKDRIAVLEAKRLNIPVIAIVDTNCDPDMIDYVIPGNDDAIRAVRLISSRIAESVLEGQMAAAEGDDQSDENDNAEVDLTASDSPKEETAPAPAPAPAAAEAPAIAAAPAQEAAPVEAAPAETTETDKTE
ncbi:30S ribosomal protein S2 [bacterium]|nr:30S ribosomal protein S2 [bacterium]